MNLLLLGAFDDFCTEMSGMLQIVGWIVTIFKFAIPLLIVILGMVDLGKAVVASKNDEIKKSATTIAYRLVAGIAIFFIPSLIMFVFGLLSDYNNLMSESEFKVCETCILKPGQCNGVGIE